MNEQSENRYITYFYICCSTETQEGSIVLADKTLVTFTLHLATTLLNHLPGFYLKTGFLNPHHLFFLKYKVLLEYCQN